ncbi:MAG: MazG nucleotide pyrophosphohydrolase domain-containing protein, partial [Microthrixaceae bacterium]
MTGPVVHVVGLGPAGADLLTAGTLALIERVPVRFLRTRRHPAATALADAPTFDDRYERAERIEDVYRGIVEELVAAAGERGEVLYAVPGSPVVAEHTVELLLADPRVRTVVHPALSFLDLAWARLGVDPVELGVRVVDGHRFALEAAGERGPLLVAQCDSAFVLSDVKLAVEDPPERPVVVLQRLGLPDESVREVAWEDLDREVVPDHLTSLWVPELGAPVAGEVARFAALMDRLRSDDPWKAEQTHDSLKKYLLEEAHEVLEAIDAYDPTTGEGAEELTAELGDLLYQVVFHSAIGAEAGWFTLADVASAIHDKLVARHPHLDAADGGPAPEVDELVTAWEVAKRAEQGRESAFDGIPAALPALARALKVSRKAHALGLAAGDPPDLAALAAAAAEDPSDPGRIGGLLAGAVELARAAGVDPEDALRRTTLAAESRYRTAESR